MLADAWVAVLKMSAIGWMIAGYGERAFAGGAAAIDSRADASSAACERLAELKLGGIKLASASTQPSGIPVTGVKLDDFSGDSPDLFNCPRLGTYQKHPDDWRTRRYGAYHER